jgi:hypothetical protein
MRSPRLAPSVFMVAYCATYAFVFFMDWPLFRYYPLNGNFNWGPQIQKGFGPAIAWYGLVADALITAILVSIVFRDRAVTGLVKSYVWIFPVAAMLVSVYLLRVFLF